jgi:hypothetical protein
MRHHGSCTLIHRLLAARSASVRWCVACMSDKFITRNMARDMTMLLQAPHSQMLQPQLSKSLVRYDTRVFVCLLSPHQGAPAGPSVPSLGSVQPWQLQRFP